jgi:hypothetical protein
MNIFSLNARGLGSQANKMALKHTINNFDLDVVLFHENMGMGDTIYDALKYFLKGWDFMALDSFGSSEGVLIGWCDKIHLINTFSITSSLFTEMESQNKGNNFYILNIYGRY